MKSALENKFQIAVLGEDSDGENWLRDTALIEWLSCKLIGDSRLEFYRGDVFLSSVIFQDARFDLPNLLGILVVSTPEVFESLCKKWRSALPTLEVPFRRLANWDAGEILSAALGCVAEDLASQRRHSGRVALQLATYRKEFDRLQHSFSRLEEYIGKYAFPRATEIFEYPPESLSVTETNGCVGSDVSSSSGRCVIQELPVDSCGLASFSLHLSAKPKAGAEPLKVKLKAVETTSILSEWSIAAADVEVGWVELALGMAIDESALSLVIIIEWPPEPGGWALSLGPRHPYREFCAQTEHGEALAAPISLRVFSNLPGVRVPANARAIRPVNSSHVQAEFVPDEVCAKVVQIFPAKKDNGPTLVSHDRSLGCITVHPSGEGVTTALMRVDVPECAWRISAQIHLAHERAGPTQFALMICAPRDEKSEAARLHQLESASPQFTGWKTLSPLERKSISLLLEPRREEQLSVCLVTRQAAGVSPDFAWARFSNFVFNLLPRSIADKREPVNLVPALSEALDVSNEYLSKSGG